MSDPQSVADPDAFDGALESVCFTGLAPGPKLLVLGAVHGNETCGPQAIRRAIADCRAGRLRIGRGAVTFVPVANPKAYRQGTREGDRNLNRDLHDKPVPLDYEDRVGNRLCALLRDHDALLDIHSFRSQGEPFVFFGPEDNAGDLEPFRQAAAEGAFAACLGAPTLIHGWLDNYARLISARERLGLPELSPSEGHGTTEYMRFCGGYGVTLECGNHEDPAAIEVGHGAILNALAHLGISGSAPPSRQARQVIRIVDLVICEQDGDRLEGSWKTGDAVAAGQPIARRASGDAVTAPSPGFIIFPSSSAKRGDGICYFGVASDRTL
ncbi:MAG TPA: succinylglutamate desuccinylase/aspartoacylase family protein [Aliidongia sp.]|uniref:succinylglutamate desuccinylase/aspartoacylase domain-containing protein n=1 Tax=Aliidongia sp. TaxID=1914230 RepID=UPI002DDCA899|nr:succinylglutamate desuccinylase/aspartoacylase family protein [Aliidongia sp.]HEV2673590.1 succinylglutamate desuccinylase/aspartoacylase family protein [Aliidongia sp.]